MGEEASPLMARATACSSSLYELLLAAGAQLVQRGKFEFLRLEEPGSRLVAARHAEILAIFSHETDLLYRADTSHYWQRRRGYLNDLTELWTVHLDGVLVGWTGLVVVETDSGKILYIDTLNVRPRALRYGFGEYSLAAVFIHEIFISYYLRAGAPLPFAFRTQNPHVYRLARAIVPRGVYPRVDGRRGREPERALRVARTLARALSPTKHFHPESSVIRAAYGGCLYGAASPALHTNEGALAAFWSRNINAPQGDAIVIVVLPTALEAAALAFAYRTTVLRQGMKDAALRWSAQWAALRPSAQPQRVNS